MSPEIRRVKPTEGWARHIRRQKAAERKKAPLTSPVVEKPKDPSQLHWESVKTVIKRTFDQDELMLKLFSTHEGFFKRFCDGRRTVELQLDTSDYQKMVDEYLNNPKSPRFNPDFWSRTSPILRVITAQTHNLLKPR